jgi:hypothetical protein
MNWTHVLIGCLVAYVLIDLYVEFVMWRVRRTRKGLK